MHKARKERVVGKLFLLLISFIWATDVFAENRVDVYGASDKEIREIEKKYSFPNKSGNQP